MILRPFCPLVEVTLSRQFYPGLSIAMGMQGFIQDFWLGGGGKSIDASTKRGNVRGYLSSLTICTDFSIVIKFSLILRGGNPSFPPSV